MPSTVITSYTENVIKTLDVNAPIGVFDSGVGGLSVFLHLSALMPNEQYLYYADTKHVPYGSRDKDDICQLTLEAVAWLVEAGCKIIVIACNSASAYALEMVRLRYPHIPIVGLVPALKPAVLASRTKQVAVLATQATLAGDLLNRVIQDIASVHGVQVTKWYDPSLVPWVESGMPTDSQTANNLLEMLANFAQQNVDQLVLGCTHYPFFREFLLTQITTQGYNMAVVDSGQAIAKRVYDLLKKADKLTLTEHNHLLKKDGVSKQTKMITASSLWYLLSNETQLTFYATKQDSRLLSLVKQLLL